jgi:hypothetical protein
LSVVITGDALTDGFLLADAIAGRAMGPTGTRDVDVDVDAWAGAVTVLRSV